ncbi:RagB/SusD family nutrient uptake outer membrane protein [Mucilaginibacter mali]|uniref:RagB/SusD family nutrient uptake outer membrane protein n=1 Tax=Mucilaginibacter mali TaxID=2740462 RepID=A0A7D4TY30_9SPHI|nr:RagB/SusD family nutrient uptake outer membrane protein [Mucilaginibacter mali]QKJ32855.1 RagB/SusD family nutrient uptake outer membrane protein [Mucilaginibacter mali]
MNIINIHKIQCLIFLSLLLVSCKKILNVSPPSNQLVTTSVFASDDVAIAAQLAVYSQMKLDNYSIDKITGLSSDELFTYATDQTTKDFYTNSLSAVLDETGTGNLWKSHYNYIYEENAILENLGKSTGISSRVKQQLTGEAKFMLGFFYFRLVNLYGNVPLVITTDPKVNASLSRATQTDIYNYIISQLTEALSLLSENYVDASSVKTSIDRVRPTKSAASALLARVYLYNKQYSEAGQQATNVINNSVYKLCSLDSVFLINNAEAIWQLMQPPTASATAEGSFFVLTAAPSGSNTSTISTLLLSAFENGDSRRTKWIGTFGTGASAIYFNNKYKAGPNATGAPKEYSVVFRLAEQYLIRAEVRAQQNDLIGAIADVNAVRKRTGLSGLPLTLTQPDVIKAIYHERQVEFFCEAHRWFDLKRSGMIDLVMGGPNGVCKAKGGNWQSYQQLYPVPVTDITNNSNILQNPGY